MVGGGKLSLISTIAGELKSLLPNSTTRCSKVFAYGFVLAFVTCTAFLAFTPSGNTTLFTTTSSISTSIAPYRDHFNSLLSHLLPPSSQIPPNEPLGSPKDGILGRGSLPNGGVDTNQTGDGAAAKKDGLSASKNTTGSGAPAKKQAAEHLGSAKDGVLSKNLTDKGNGSERIRSTDSPAVKNQTSKAAAGSIENGVLSKNQTDTGNGPERIRSTDAPAVKNQTSKAAAGSTENVVLSKNQTDTGNGPERIRSTDAPAVKNQTSKAAAGSTENVVLSKNQTDTGNGSERIQSTGAQTAKAAPDSLKNGLLENDLTGEGVATGVKKSAAPAVATAVAHKGSNLSASLMKSSSSVPALGDGKKDSWIDQLAKCDLFQGKWVQDDTYPLYPEGSCPHIDEPFDCYHNGRKDRAYQKLRWQPDGCNIPRLNGTDMLERLRGKRLVFVGDSLNRNMWESLVCVLRNSVKNKKKVFEASGRREFRTEGSYSFLFKDYGCTVEFFRSPFLVQEWEMPDHNGSKKETLRLDLVERSASKYKDAHAIIFNTGHWWTHDKTAQGRDYYQEGNHVYSELNVAEAFHKALNTWAKWVDANVNPKKTHVFFRGYSASHFSGGQWNSGGQCDKETEPIKNERYLSSYPPKMSILEEVIKGMKTSVSYMNITRMTDYRKDAHPSIYRSPHMTAAEKADIQDCSHWCLPGVPDSWNELLYAQLLIKQHQAKH